MADANLDTVGVAPGTLTLRLADGEVIEIARWIDDQLYGTGQLSNAQTTDTVVFSAGIAKAIPGGSRVQTQVDTNIPKEGGNGLPQSWEMRVFALTLLFGRASLVSGSNADTLITDTSESMSVDVAYGLDRLVYCTYTYNTRDYMTGTPLDFPAGKGLVPNSTLGSYSTAQNGVPSPRDRRALSIPIREKENLGYTFTLHPVASLSFSQVARNTANTTFTRGDVKVGKFGLIKKNVA